MVVAVIIARTQSEGANLCQAAVLKYRLESHFISCEKYFCRIAKFGEDVRLDPCYY